MKRNVKVTVTLGENTSTLYCEEINPDFSATIALLHVSPNEDDNAPGAVDFPALLEVAATCGGRLWRSAKNGKEFNLVLPLNFINSIDFDF